MIVDDFTDWVGCRRAVADFRLVRGLDASHEPIQVASERERERAWLKERGREKRPFEDTCIALNAAFLWFYCRSGFVQA